MKMNKRKIVWSAAAVFVFVFFIGAGSSQSAGSFALPAVESRVTDKGSKIFFIKDELPLFSVTLSFGYGKLYEDKNSAGLGELFASCLSLGGSKNYKGNKLHEFIESMGGSISVNSSWERISVSVTVLHRFRRQAVEALSDLVLNPNFDEGAFETAKMLALDNLNRMYDDPSALAFEKAREIIFEGKGYGSFQTREVLGGFTIDDVKKLWQRCFTAKNLIAGIVYYEDYNNIVNLLELALSPMYGGESLMYSSDSEAVKQNVKALNNTVFLYPKEIPQATIVVGTWAPAVLDKENIPLAVMNYILGGGSFNSRLMNEIRVKRGLAYSVGSVVRDRAHTGVFLAYAQTANDNVSLALSLLVENINSMASKQVGDEELTWAKNAISNSYIFSYETPSDVLSKYIVKSLYSLPDDYYDSYLDKINGVKAAEVMDSASILLEPGLVKMVVGSKELIPQLEKFGKVEVLR